MQGSAPSLLQSVTNIYMGIYFSTDAKLERRVLYIGTVSMTLCITDVLHVGRYMGNYLLGGI